MASNYPSSADALSNPASGDALSTGHAAQHANANDAIEAIESTLGLNPQGASATVKARLDAIEADSWVTSARILDGTIVNGDVSASADHIVPVSVGGSDELANLRLVHLSCNCARRAAMLDEQLAIV